MMIYSQTLIRSFALLLLVLSGPVAKSATFEKIDLLAFDLPKDKAFVTSKASSDSCYGVYVVLQGRDKNGTEIEGIGEILPRTLMTNESRADSWAGAKIMRQFLLGAELDGDTPGEDMAKAEDLMAGLREIAAKQDLTWKNPPPSDAQLRATLAGFDMALLDFIGKKHGRPIYELLGGRKRDSVTLSTVTFSANVDTDILAEKARRLRSEYPAIRIKLGLDSASDLERVRAVARVLVEQNQGRALWVDMNKAWADLPEAKRELGLIRKVLQEEGFQGRFICEAPMKDTRYESLAALTAEMRDWNRSDKFQIAIMADEGLWDLGAVKKLVASDAADMVNIKIQKSGGMLEAMRMAAYLQEKAPHIDIYIGGLVMTDLCARANLHLAIALPGLDYVTGCLPRDDFPIQPSTNPLKFTNGRDLAAPEGGGLGADLNRADLELYITKSHP